METKDLVGFAEKTLPAFGVLLGFWLQSRLSRFNEAAKAVSTLRVQAYIDYLSALSASALGTTDSVQTSLKALESQTRIAVYGSDAVLIALAEFRKVGSSVASNGGSEAVLRLAKAMRDEYRKAGLGGRSARLFPNRRDEIEAMRLVLGLPIKH